MKTLTTYFTKGELGLWGGSAGLILVSFFLFDRVNFMTLAASLIGTTSLIFNAKGNPIGQALMILFSLLYGVISYTFSYFGEMITYLGMTGPMALFAYVSWLRNPYNGNHAEVAVNRLENKELALLYVLTAGVTFGFYFIMDQRCGFHNLLVIQLLGQNTCGHGGGGGCQLSVRHHLLFDVPSQ